MGSASSGVPRPLASSATTSFDVVVVGGGVMGSWAAARVATRGASCALLDQFEPGHDKGSSHGDGRIYRFAYVEDVYVDMMGYSLGLWEELQAFSGKDLMAKTGGVVTNFLSARGTSHDTLAHLEAMYMKRGALFEGLSAEALRERFPQYVLPTDMEALYQPDMGVLFATTCVRAAWALAESQGAKLRPNTQVSKIVKNGEFMVVVTANGEELAAKRVILAPGAWLSSAATSLFGLQIPTRVTAETVSYFATREKCEVDHTFRSMPVFMTFLSNGISDMGYYGLPAVDVPGVKVAAHHAGPLVNPSQRPKSAGGLGASREEEEAAAKRVAEILASNKRLIAAHFPGLEPEPFFSHNCLYTDTPDHDYIIDRVPGFEAVVLAGGGSGHAFKMGPAIGELCACLALGEDPPVSVGDTFSLSRPALKGEYVGPAPRK